MRASQSELSRLSAHEVVQCDKRGGQDARKRGAVIGRCSVPRLAGLASLCDGGARQCQRPFQKGGALDAAAPLWLLLQLLHVLQIFLIYRCACLRPEKRNSCAAEESENCELRSGLQPRP